jgi:uncharacterized protein (DUF2225 family)
LLKLGVIKKLSSAKKYARGTVMAQAGNVAEMYIVLRGEVGLFYNYSAQNKTMDIKAGPGEFFGETALFLEKGMPYTAVALTDVFALPVNRFSVIDFLRDEPEMAFELLKEMSGRLDGTGGANERPNAAAPKPHPAKAPAVKPEAPKAEAPAAPPPPAPAAKPEPEGPSPDFSLFPEGHGSYQLQMSNADTTYLMEKSYTCPICKKEFKGLKVKTSKLVLDKTDSDMRTRYQGIEPMYYDVVTCPHCLFSALSEMFGSIDKPAPGLLAELQAIKPQANVKTGVEMDTFSVFAGYYLALYCAPKCFTGYRLATAKLLLKLSRIYQDCGDGPMEEETSRRALEAYMDVYQNVDISASLDQQLCLIVGELHLKLNDLANAKSFFFKAKANRDGTPLLKDQAESRIMDIRVMEGKG